MPGGSDNTRGRPTPAPRRGHGGADRRGRTLGRPGGEDRPPRWVLTRHRVPRDVADKDELVREVLVSRSAEIVDADSKPTSTKTATQPTGSSTGYSLTLKPPRRAAG